MNPRNISLSEIFSYTTSTAPYLLFVIIGHKGNLTNHAQCQLPYATSAPLDSSH